MTIKEFINKALQGGWKPERHRQVTEFNPNNRTGAHSTVRASYTHLEILLDPEAWRAVGKSCGWCDSNVGINGACVDCGFKVHEPVWLTNMHAMVDSLASGKTLEEYIATL